MEGGGASLTVRQKSGVTGPDLGGGAATPLHVFASVAALPLQRARETPPGVRPGRVGEAS